MHELIEYKISDDRICIINFNRPEKSNAFTLEMFRKFSEALQLAENSDNVSAVVLSASGNNFSSGVDLNIIDQPKTDPEAFSDLMKILAGFSKPLIAAVKGASVGFGATLLFYCDVVYAADDSRFKFPFTELGLVPEAGSSYLAPLIMGYKNAAELIFTAKWFDGDTAKTIGLLSQLFPKEQVLEQAMLLARAMAQHPTRSVVESKRLLKKFHENNIHIALHKEAKAMERLLRNKDYLKTLNTL